MDEGVPNGGSTHLQCFHFLAFRGLSSGRIDSAAGANFCARTALDASVGIDVVDIALRDSLNGANGQTSAASYARIGNNVSHSKLIIKS